MRCLRKVMDQIAIPQTCPGHGRCSHTPPAVKPIRIIPSSSPLASAALALALALAGCGITSDGDSASGGTGDTAGGDGAGGEGASPPPAPPAVSTCVSADDCVAASSICCECPSFAVAAESGFDDGCGQVDCQPPDGCALVEPACIDSQCHLICQPVPTDKVCANGFARDSFGCLVDACREDPPDEVFACALDEDCSEVKADCCGCELGGTDTAVATSAVAQYLDSLACHSDPVCPGIDFCDAALVPRCVAQSCTLGPPESEPAGSIGSLCGVPDQAACGDGQVCVLNDPEGGDASRMGVGSCRAARP